VQGNYCETGAGRECKRSRAAIRRFAGKHFGDY
jgi:hypothetical protein